MRINVHGIETNEFVVVSFKARRKLIDKLDKLVESGVFPSRSEAIREAIVMLLKKYLPNSNLSEVTIKQPRRSMLK